MPSPRRREKWASKNAAIRDSEVLHKLHLLPSRLIKKYSILHTISREEMGQSQQEANQTMLHKGNTGYLKNITTRAHSVLGTDSLASPLPRRQELCSQDLKPQLPQGPSPRPLPAWSSMFLVLEKKLTSFLIHQILVCVLGGGVNHLMAL